MIKMKFHVRGTTAERDIDSKVSCDLTPGVSISVLTSDPSGSEILVPESKKKKKMFISQKC